MRRRAEWMVPVDDLILEHLRDVGASTPKAMADEIGRHNDYIGDRCRTLMDAGLTQRVSHGLYRISEMGERYLNEELEEGELEEDAS